MSQLPVSDPTAQKDGGTISYSRLQGVCTVTVLCILVWAVYCPPALLDGSHTLMGMDFTQLHTHRIRYAQEALMGEHPHLPGWHSRELLGAPFWSNAQDFPFIPTRLVLLLFNPFVAFAVGVNLAATLAAIFTYLYGRSIGLGQVPAAAAGWTFASSGFFASRVMAGHLPLLEAYPALPLMLWLAERCLQSTDGDPRRPLKFLSLGLAGTCVVLAGHPQLPAYTIAATFLYLLIRGRNRVAWRAAGAIICGIGVAAFALYPMLRLIQRSTRVLHLDEPTNNVYFPYERLLALLFPWKDGAAPGVRHATAGTFSGDMSAFWDTVCYVGWLPIIAASLLLFRGIVQRTMPARPWLCLAVGGTLSTLLALPFMQQMLSWIPGTILRSPARQFYLTTFSLSLAVGAALHLSHRSATPKTRKWIWGAVTLGLLAHFFDLGAHARSFINVAPLPTKITRTIDPRILTLVGDGRVAIDYGLQIDWNRDLDDVGFFDSIILAKPYQAVLAMSGASPRLNVQGVLGAALNARTLSYTGVQLVITTVQRNDLPRIQTDGPIILYSVPLSQARAQFIPQPAARFLAPEEVIAQLRDQSYDPRQTILLPRDAAPVLRTNSDPSPAASIQYERESGDSITMTVKTAQPGYVRILESWDPGWTASVDGKAAAVLCADHAVIAMAIGPETREVRLRFETPGARTGIILAIGSLCALVGLAGFSWRQKVSPTAAALSCR